MVYELSKENIIVLALLCRLGMDIYQQESKLDILKIVV